MDETMLSQRCQDGGASQAKSPLVNVYIAKWKITILSLVNQLSLGHFQEQTVKLPEVIGNIDDDYYSNRDLGIFRPL